MVGVVSLILGAVVFLMGLVCVIAFKECKTIAQITFTLVMAVLCLVIGWIIMSYGLRLIV